MAMLAFELASSTHDGNVVIPVLQFSFNLLILHKCTKEIILHELSVWLCFCVFVGLPLGSLYLTLSENDYILYSVRPTQ